MSDDLKKELKFILLSLAIFFTIMILDKTGAVPMIFENRWLSLVLYLIPYFMAGWKVVRNAFLGIKNHQPFDESFLMFIATVGAFITGENSEAVAVMLFYQVGEWFQSYALGKSRKSISDLMEIAPEFANVVRADGSVETVDPDDVEVGDVLVIRPGEKIPVDAVVRSGDSMINTAALTGESVPRTVHPGDQVISGCINGEGLLKVEAQKAYEDSTVAKILELVEDSADKKSHTEQFITRFARVYTPIVVYAALALAIIPSIITRDPATWIYRACTFLVISCPCALVIAVPLAFFGGIGAASRNGVLVKGSNYLELLAKLDTVVSDKTGTLTEGTFEVSAVDPAPGVDEKEILTAAALAEGASTHPIAISIRSRLKEELPDTEIDMTRLTDTDNVSGQGLIATVDGKRIYVGNGKLMEAAHVNYKEASDPAATVVYVAEEAENQVRYLGSISIRDTVKPDAKRAIAEMKASGVRRVVMLTGDRKSVGDAVGKELGIDKVYSELLPQDKVTKVEELLKELDSGSADKVDRALAFVGDGINDAPVLMRSDVGIAMGSMGSDAAIEAADVVIMDDNLRRIPVVIRIARKTLRLSTENIVFAIAVKILILILGALGLAGMWAAVFADVGVACLCILNSMRLLRFKKAEL